MKRAAAIALACLAWCHVCSRAEAFTLRNAPGGERALSTATDRPSGVPEWIADAGNPSDEPKSKARAFAYSLLLPGWGHAYAGDKRGARTFLAVELSAWTAFVVFEAQGRLREQGYEEFASVFAGVSGDHSDDYYALIAEYDSWEDYELVVKTEGRFALYPGGDAASLEKYFVENRVSDYEPWEWKSSDVRRDYRSLRSASKRSYRRALYSAAVAAINRVASGFFALKAANDANAKREEGRVGYRLEFGAPVVGPSDGLQTGLTFVATF